MSAREEFLREIAAMRGYSEGLPLTPSHRELLIVLGLRALEEHLIGWPTSGSTCGGGASAGREGDEAEAGEGEG